MRVSEHRVWCCAGRAAIQKNATGLATTVGADALGASGIVADPPAGSDDLLLHMLYTLTGAGVPNQAAAVAATAMCASGAALPHYTLQQRTLWHLTFQAAKQGCSFCFGLASRTGWRHVQGSGEHAHEAASHAAQRSSRRRRR